MWLGMVLGKRARAVERRADYRDLGDPHGCHTWPSDPLAQFYGIFDIDLSERLEAAMNAALLSATGRPRSSLNTT